MALLKVAVTRDDRKKERKKDNAERRLVNGLNKWLMSNRGGDIKEGFFVEWD